MMKLGTQVKDKITGFTGTLTAWVVYINGCEQGQVQPKVGKDGKYEETHWFDKECLESAKGPTIELDTKSSGFGDPAPKR